MIVSNDYPRWIQQRTIVSPHAAEESTSMGLSIRWFVIDKCGEIITFSWKMTGISARAPSSRLTGIFFRPSLTELADITRMNTMVQTTSGKFLLENERTRRCQNGSTRRYLREFQILRHIVADKIEFEVMVDREEESIENLAKQKERDIQTSIDAVSSRDERESLSTVAFTNRMFCSIKSSEYVDTVSSFMPIIRFYFMMIDDNLFHRGEEKKSN